MLFDTKDVRKDEKAMEDENKELDQPSFEASRESAAAGTAPAKQKLSETAAEVKEKVGGLGRKAVEQIDQSRRSAAGALDQTASSLHSGADRVSGVAHSTADGLQSTADYIRRTDLAGMGKDIQDLVTRYPGISLAAAAFLGFLVARSLRSDE
jgi:hypothetical protein